MLCIVAKRVTRYGTRLANQPLNNEHAFYRSSLILIYWIAFDPLFKPWLEKATKARTAR